ncbi:acyl-CoA dehydrogenase family protein [Chloroflexota bacterium]
MLTWELFTEPEAGTDEANQQTNALRHVREKDHFIVNGQKIFVGTPPAPPDQFLLLTRSDLKAPRHENLAMFLTQANLPGITIQPLDLFPTGTFAHLTTPAVDKPFEAKHSVFFDDVRIHEACLIGGERDGWKVVSATLDVEHGGGAARVPRENFAVETFLSHCKSNPNTARRLKENPQLLYSVVDTYISAQIERLLSTRNAWLANSGNHVPYSGPQLGLYTKMFGCRAIADMAKVLGPYPLIDDAEWSLEDDMFEVLQRGGVCTAPAGTPEAQRIIISRGLRIGR